MKESDAYKAGRRAFFAGVRECPYTDYHRAVDWDAGWNDAASY